MPDFLSVLPPAKATRLTNTMCGRHAYDKNKEKDETRAQFTNRQITHLLKDQVKTWEHTEHSKAFTFIPFT